MTTQKTTAKESIEYWDDTIFEIPYESAEYHLREVASLISDEKERKLLGD